MSIEPPSYEDINHNNNDAYRVSHPDQTRFEAVDRLSKT